MEWFKVYTDWFDMVDLMTDEEAGQMIKAVYAYVLRGEKRTERDRLELFLAAVYKTLSRDREKFDLAMAEETQKKEALRKKRSDAGRKGAISKHAKEAYAYTDHHLQDVAETDSVLPDAASVCHNMPDKNKNIDKDTDKDTEREKDPEGEKERETDGEGDDGGSSSVPPPAVTELPVLTIPLVNGKEHPVYRRDIEEYVSLYPDVSVEQELRNMRGWCLANPTRRKTRKGVRTFINSWLKKSQQESALRQEVPENPFLAYARGEKTFGDLVL